MNGCGAELTISEEHTSTSLLKVIQPEQWVNIQNNLGLATKPERLCATCCLSVLGLANVKTA